MAADTPSALSDRAVSEISRVEELSYELKIKDVMTGTPQTLHPEMLMNSALTLFRHRRISGAPVLDGEKLVGILSLEDLIRCLQAGDLQATVSEYMTKNLITVNAMDPVIKALEKFTQSRVGRLPVLEPNGKLAGIITKGDITNGLLNALHTNYQNEEVRRYRASHLFEDIVSDRTSLILRYQVKVGDFTRGGKASSDIKRALLRLGANTQIARRAGIAIYEAEMNLIIHTTNGGIIRVEIEPYKITIKVVDEGPGIANTELALKPGFSTAADSVREMGFGAGMGLPNIARCVDKMHLESVLGRGTRLEMKIYVDQEKAEAEEAVQPVI